MTRGYDGRIRADARYLPIADQSVQCVVTSPPYWGLRDYGSPDQIGLEKTPEAYVASMLTVFREVWRVLRQDGTCWLNLGDSYNSAFGSGLGPSRARSDTRKQTDGRLRGVTENLKPKDLVGIPWRVAFALQQPWYAGRIKSEFDRVWLAAMMDGEGCFYIHKRKVGQHAGDGYFRQTDNYAPAFEVANTSERIIKRCMQIAGCGSVIRQEKDRRQPLYRWTVRCDEARGLARELHPHLVAKQQQARIVYGCPTNGELAEAAHAGLKLLHAGLSTMIDFKAPPTMFVPGWYLRSDIIWAKPNPMPESVTDRPTRSHEYIFLLTKSERYYYDAEAIAEQSGGWNGSKFTDDRDLTIHPNTGRNRWEERKALGEGSRRGFSQNQPPGCSQVGIGETRNKRSVWTVSTAPYPEAHYATFPPELIEPCILAGSKPGDIVLDPFFGSGTVGRVCEQFSRRWIGVDLGYQELQAKRVKNVQKELLETL